MKKLSLFSGFDNKMGLPSKQTLYLFFSTCVVNLFTFSVAVTFAWTSPFMPILRGYKHPEDNPLDKPIDSNQQSLLTSIYFIGSMIGPFLAGIVASKIGRKKTILIFTLPTCACLIIKAFATDIFVFYLARFIGGVSGSTIYTLVPIFVAEKSQPHNRGVLGTIHGIFSVLGNLYCYSVGSYMSIKWFSISGLAGPALLWLIFPYFISETPYYYVARKDLDQAKKVLRSIRKGSEKELDAEIEQIQRTLEARKEFGGVVDILRDEAGRRSLFIIAVGVAIQQLSGMFVVQLYLSSIFDAAGTDLSTEASSSIVGVVKVFSFFLTVLCVDRMGRKILLLQSQVGTFISLVCLGTYFVMKKNDADVSSLNWMPLLFLLTDVICYNSGMGIIPLVQLGECFPQKFKAAASIVVITMSACLSFIVTFTFPYMRDGMGEGASFLMYSVSPLIGFVFTIFMVPETKGKTFLEIQELFIKSKK